jgi:hypothetical protein
MRCSPRRAASVQSLIRGKHSKPRRNSRSKRSARSLEILIRAVWLDSPPSRVEPSEIEGALRLARRNHVAGRLARAYPKLLPNELARAQEHTAAFRGNLAESTRRLLGAGIQPVLIKANDCTYSNFDLVVGDEGWSRAIEALVPWGRRCSRHRAEPGKVLVHPETGPAAHLHREVSWFGVPIVSSQRLAARSVRNGGDTWWVPEPVDELRIILAHAAFQNLALDLSELLSLRGLLQPRFFEEARAEANAEGWGRGFDFVFALALSATRRLDRADVLPLPFPLPVIGSISIGVEHATYLWRVRKRAAAARETALRMPLILAKRRRLHLA